MKMTSGESSLRMPKEATCDVECAMKVEEIRILNKKRKQSQRVGSSNGAVMSKVAVNGGKAAKRALTPADLAGPGGAAPPSLSKASSAGGGGGGSKDSKDSSRRRFVWSVPLHQDFVAAVFDVGLKCASPKLLLEMMPVVDGLTSEHIKSHLQKYRLHRQRSREEFLKSYNYLTDLDGGKGLGGGSAAATVAKAAAAAAGCGGGCGGGGGGGGTSKRPFSGCGRNLEPTGCGSSCDCNDTSGMISSGGAGGGKAGAPPDAGKSEGSERSCGGGGAKAGLLQAGGGMEAVVASLGEKTASGEAVNGALLMSHLELLAKGIDMQVQFHNHLRDVVESQQQLHTQLAGRQGNGHVPQRPAEGAGGSPRTTAPPSSAGMASPPVVDFSSPAGQQDDAGGGGVRVKELKQVQRELRLVVGGGGGGGSLTGYRPLSGSQQQQQAPATASGGLGWRVAGGAHKASGSSSSSSAADPASSGSAAEAPVQRGAPAPAPGDLSADHHSSLRGDKTGEVGNTQRQHHQPQPRHQHENQHQHQHQHQFQQFNPTVVREALSVQAGAGEFLLGKGLLSMDGPTSRGYVPGEYTLTSKASETVASNGNAQMAHTQTTLPGPGDRELQANRSSTLAARNPAEARASLAAAGLAPPMPTMGSAQEALALQKHMQSQMSLQESMISASNNQVTDFDQRAWCGVRGAGPASGGGGAAGASASRSGASGGGRTEVHKEGSGGGGGGEGGGGGAGAGGASAGVGIKEQRLDSLSLHPGEGGESSSMMGMGLLQQDDMFDLGSMLDRGTELESGESPAEPRPNARPGGNEHSMFSFLME